MPSLTPAPLRLEVPVPADTLDELKRRCEMYRQVAIANEQLIRAMLWQLGGSITIDHATQVQYNSAAVLERTDCPFTKAFTVSIVK